MLSLSDTGPRVRPDEAATGEETAWRRALRDAVRDPVELGQLVDLDLKEPPFGASSDFPLLVPRGYVSRMRPGDPDDPLLLQVVPRTSELDSTALPADAVGDLAARRAPGMIQKYRGRVLLTVAGSCAVNCRYCFRRSFPYEDLPHGDRAWAATLDAIANDHSVSEIILSGGDPLVLGDAPLTRLIHRLSTIPHLRRLRIHSRLPVVIPERVTDALCKGLQTSRLQATVVLHINHANEIDDSVRIASRRLRQADVHLLNQSVLLRGVNDSVDALVGLSEALFDASILPYYLHQLDLVAGVSHFEISVVEGLRLVEGLKTRLPGYLVPRYVRETAGEPAKTTLA